MSYQPANDHPHLDPGELGVPLNREIALGEDPRKPKRSIPTVAEAFDRVIALRSPTWTGKATALSWRASREEYCQPILSKRISDVTPADVLSILEPIWHDKAATAKNVRSHLSAVMDWAVQMEFRANNPAHPGVTRFLGPQPLPDHHPHLNPGELGAALGQIRDADAWWAEVCCLLFMAFTVTRSSEACSATWDEIDWETNTWHIPAARMKGGDPHAVPLSSQAVGILTYAKARTNGEGPIFPAERGGKCLASARLSALMRRLEIPATPHGIRSSFRNWAMGHPEITPTIGAIVDEVLTRNPNRRIDEVFLADESIQERMLVTRMWADYLTETMGPVAP